VKDQVVGMVSFGWLEKSVLTLGKNRPE